MRNEQRSSSYLTLGDHRRRIEALEKRPLPQGGSSSFLGILGGYGGVDLAVTNPGGLLFRYKFDEAGPSPAGLSDTAGFPSGPWNLTYNANTGGSDPANGETWDAAHDVTYKVLEHPAFGTADDGSMKFNYNQLHNPGGDEGTWASVLYPGAWFSNNSAPWWGTGVNDLKSVSVFFYPRNVAPAAKQGIIGRANFFDTNQGLNGWALYVDTDGKLKFFGYDGTNSSSMETPGALTANRWYHAVVTWDAGATNLWTLYLNGVVVATITQANRPTLNGSVGGIRIGGVTLYGNFPDSSTAQGFFYGDVDEVDGYRIPLTLAQVQAIYAARDAGTGTTMTTVTIGAGSEADPFSIKSYDPEGGIEPSGYVMESDGYGGTQWVLATGLGGGVTWYTGSGVPAAGLGVTGDLYLENTGEVWSKATGVWVDTGTNLTGPTWFTQAADPVTSPPVGARDGDFTIRETNGEVYKRVLGTFVDQGFSLSPPRKLLMTWGGLVPDAASSGKIWEVPYDTDGSSYVFSATRAVARLETAFGSDQTFRLQKSAGGNAAFSATPTTICDVTVVAGDYRGEQTGLSFTLTSGDLVRLDFTAVGSGSEYSLELEATA